jgi:hypothetical protein
MKTIMIFIFLCMGALLFFGSCSNSISPTGDTLPPIKTFDNCPPPEMLPNGQGAKNVPKYIHIEQKRSFDGSKIAYTISENRIGVADVKTGEIQVFNPNTMMPSGFRFNGCFGLCWCPYDNNKLALNFVTGFDTVIDGNKRSFYGQNLFILSIKENRLSRVNLPNVGFAGPNEFEVYDWVKGSTPSADSILLACGYGQNLFIGIFVLQTNTLVHLSEIENLIQSSAFPAVFSFSPDRKHFLIFKEGGPVYADDILLPLDDTYDILEYISWSPDSKKLVLTGYFNKGEGHVGVIDMDKWFRERPSVLPIQKIDFRKRFCMYNLSSYTTIDAEFLTNTTLAVSMHHDGDMISPLWEITTDGRLLRQLTR